MRIRIATGALCIATGCYSGVDDPNLGSDTEGPTASGSAEAGETETASDSSPETAGETEGETEGAGDLDPGRVTLHRLNRAEYNNTIRDLFFGLDVSPADQFPADDHSFGFDNIADALNMTPLLFELYERAAETTIDAALAANGGGDGEVQRVEAEVAGSDVGAACCGGYWNLSTTGSITTTVDVAVAGAHEIRVMAAGQQAGPDLPNMVVRVDGLEVGSFDVAATEAAPSEHVVELDLDQGGHSVEVEFTNDFFDMGSGADRNLLVDYIDLAPQGGPGGGDIRSLVLVCDPAPGAEGPCNREIIQTFADRAWRRPVTDEEIDALVVFVDEGLAEGGTWEDGIKLALKATLLSPNFIFRVELDPDPTAEEAHPLSDWELASRLSYFVWSSMPDDALFAAAEAGELSDPTNVEDQVRRMLASPKAGALATNFAGNWLYTRAITADLVKDAVTYPEWDDDLRVAFKTEMEMFVESFLSGGRSLPDLLTGKQTFVNDRLAAFYGLPLVGTDEFVEVSLMGQPRKGLLTTGGLMSVLSHPNITSPVKRGKWVLEQLLCNEPPDPPPGVEATVDTSIEDGPMREKLAMHREKPECAVCHNLMDPIGLALEHYDGVGKWRETEGQWEIDASGELPPPVGGQFEDAIDMVELIAQSEEFAHCTAEKAFIYGLGRGPEKSDDDYLDQITSNFMGGGLLLEDLIVQITLSDAFTMRRGEPEE